MAEEGFSIDDLNTNTTFDCIVIGGGVSGVSFAHYLSGRGENVLILEKSSFIGGQTCSVPSQIDADYYIELGAHTCYHKYLNLLSIVSDIGFEADIQPLGKCSYTLYADNKVKSVLSQISFLPMIVGGSKLFFTSQKGKTVKEYFRPIVGKSNYDKLFTNLFRAVLCQKADDYPAELFLKRRKDRRKDIPYKFSFKRGLSSFLEEVVNKNAIPVALDTEVVGVKQNSDKSFSITEANGKVYKALNLVFASNPQMSAKLMVDIEPDMAKILSTIPMFNSESIGVTVLKESLDIEKVAGIIPLSDEFLSVVSKDVVEHPKLRSFTFHFHTGVNSRQDKIKTICKVLKISESQLLESISVSHTLPSLRMQHVNLSEQLDKARNNKSVFITGNYFYGLSLEDCVARSKDEVANYISTA